MMAQRTETLKLIISGDGRLLGTEIGNTQRKIETFGSRVGRVFSNLDRKILSSVKSIATNPLTLVGGTAGLLYAGKQVIDYQNKLLTLGINAKRTDSEIMQLEKTVTDFAYTTGQDRDKLVEVLSDIIDKTGDFQYATTALGSVGQASTAMAADIMDTGRVLSALRLGLGATAEEAQEYFDIMARMGNEGSFTFAEQASQAERLFSAATLAVGIQKENFAEYNAFMQTVKPMFGSPDMAGTAIESIMNKLKTSGKSIQAKLGFRLFDEKGAIVDFKKTIKAIARLSPAERSKMFGEYSKAFTAFDTEKGKVNFEKYIQLGKVGGFVAEAFERRAKGATYQVNTIVTALKEFATVGLTPVIEKLTEKLRELTSDPEKMENFRVSIQNLAGGIGDLSAALISAAPAFELLGVIADFTGISQRSKLTKEAAKELKALPKSDQKKIRSLVRGDSWDTGLYMALQKFKREQNQNVVGVQQQITVVAPEGTKVLSTTDSTNADVQSSISTSNRGSFK
jgi:hypothetical protein